MKLATIIISVLMAPTIVAQSPSDPFVLYGWAASTDAERGTDIDLSGTLFDHAQGIDPKVGYLPRPGGGMTAEYNPYDSYLGFGSGPYSVLPNELAPCGPLDPSTEVMKTSKAGQLHFDYESDYVSVYGVTVTHYTHETPEQRVLHRTSKQIAAVGNRQALFIGRITVDPGVTGDGTLSGNLMLMFPHEDSPLVEDPARRVAIPIQHTVHSLVTGYQVVAIPQEVPINGVLTLWEIDRLVANDLYIVWVD